MTTLAEIEAAVDQLPMLEQKALLRFVAERVHRSAASTDDPMTALIGAFRSGHHTTAEDAEDVLYGRDGNP